ncbi:MAG: hypothetical protein HY841_13360 [Bacteroidetes bacterium]|nr:hypothetical protein [Bacteroidota bacterium]
MRQFNLPIAVSNSHVHLSEEHFKKLFGQTVIEKADNIGHPKFFTNNLTVTLSGQKGKLENIKVLLPCSKDTLVELNRTHSYLLGVNPPLADGELTDGFITISTPTDKIEVKKNVVIERRHIEITKEQADKWNLTNGQFVKVFIDGQRSLTFNKVGVKIVVKINPSFNGRLELDRDEANSAMVNHGDIATIIVG